MGMDVSYQALHQRVKELEFRAKDMMDDPTHASAQSLLQAIHLVKEELEMCKGMRTIEEHIEVIKRLTDEARHHEGGYMNVHHANELHDAFEDLRREVRKHPHYV